MPRPHALDPELRRHLEQHTPEAIRRQLIEGPPHSYLEDFVLGAVDGAVTTFAVVSGVVGAGFSSHVLLVLGAANLAADGLSMAAGNYLGARAELERREKLRNEELRHIRVYPEGEREEIRQIFRLKGLEGPLLERVVDAITSDVETWVEVMLKEQHGVVGKGRDPWRAAATTYAAFVLAGAVPLLPFVRGALDADPMPRPFASACVGTAAAFAIVGILRARTVERSVVRCVAETLSVGGLAAAVAYGVGTLLSRWL